MRTSRRNFLRTAASASIGVAAAALAKDSVTMSQTQPDPPKPPKPPKPPQLKPELVYEFVGAAHGDLDKVKQMLEAEPGLLHASWNWGGFDWESAIEAAAHMGRRDIAEYLLGKGARINLFASAMLGDLEVVKSILTVHPGLITSQGAHGITLLRHAEMGGDPAKPVRDYLVKLGAT